MSKLTDPIILANAMDLSSFGYFQRSTVKEFIMFFSRNLIAKTEYGQRQTVSHEDYICHIHLQANGFGGIFVCDKEYPQRAAYTALSLLLKEFHEIHGEIWPELKEDTVLSFPKLDEAIVEFQDPSKIDKFIKINQELEKTISIVHKTIDSVMNRGETLENLVQKSEDLGLGAKLFYANASSTKCCVIM